MQDSRCDEVTTLVVTEMIIMASQEKRIKLVQILLCI